MRLVSGAATDKGLVRDGNEDAYVVDPRLRLFAIADGSVLVEVDPNDPSRTVAIAQGSIVGEVGLISGRKRGATVRTGEGAIVIEIPRNAALKLMATSE